MVRNKNRKTRYIIIAFAILLISVSSYSLYRYFSQKPTESTAVTESVISDVNNEPATDDEKMAGEQAQNDIDRRQQSLPTPNTKKEVQVRITSWGSEGSRFEVSSYANTFESTGNCYITLKKGSVVLRGMSTATQSATTMSCGTLSVEGSKITPGTWNATVTYKSTESNGSLTKPIVVE